MDRDSSYHQTVSRDDAETFHATFHASVEISCWNHIARSGLWVTAEEMLHHMSAPIAFLSFSSSKHRDPSRTHAAYARVYVLTAANTNTVLWDVTSCCLVQRNKLFGIACCFDRHQGTLMMEALPSNRKLKHIFVRLPVILHPITQL
jgi:hypothetical protein